MSEIKKDINIRELVEKHPKSIAVLMKYGFHCLGCVAAQFENLEQGATAHGIDVDALVKDINLALNEEDLESKEEVSEDKSEDKSKDKKED